MRAPAMCAFAHSGLRVDVGIDPYEGQNRISGICASDIIGESSPGSYVA